MGKVVLMISVSLDGFIEGPDRGIDWHRVDEELHLHFNDELRRMSGFIEGRVTYELMEDYWPTADRDPGITPATREFAGIWRDTPKIVFSRTLEGVGPNATLRREVVPDEIRRLEGEYVVGGADLAGTFLRHGLVDEFRVYVHPVVIGAGKPLFRDLRLDLRLVESRAFGSGVVLVRYSVDR